MTHIPWRYTEYANINFLCKGFGKSLSDRQTDPTEIIYYATSRVVQEWTNAADYIKVERSAEDTRNDGRT